MALFAVALFAVISWNVAITPALTTMFAYSHLSGVFN